ncbi:MAG: alginate lyase family protein [Bacteroidota bacterium]|nr:heparinase II/III family protein [Candidatus Kapabacteria bacterium]MDW8219814.1 alginate lyase family protein [Bacteroidota bacterium]
MQRFFHYIRVLYYRVIKPYYWRVLILKRVAQERRSSFTYRVHTIFFNAEDHTSIATALHSTSMLEALVSQANDALQHRFPLLSSTPREHGEQLDWHRDYASGRVWRSDQSAHMLDFLTSEHGSDVKYVWDMNRCYWFAWLGIAHLLLPHDKRYAQAFLHDAISWQHANPLGMGINWSMPMEVAIRATNWVLAYSFFCSSQMLSEAFWQRYFHTLWQHGMFLSYNLEYVRHNGNHFLSNAMGLVVLGAFFYRHRIGRMWFRKGQRFLEQEIVRQFTKDGVNYEKSTLYHRLTVEMLLIAAIAAEQVGMRFSDVFYERLTNALIYIAAYTRPDGSAPMIGDSDNGRIIKFIASEDTNIHLPTLLLGAYHCNLPLVYAEYSHLLCTHSIDSLILTHRAYQAVMSTNISASFSLQNRGAGGEHHFIYGGYIIHKSSTSHLFIDVGDYGMQGWGGHGHNDCLSFEWWLHGGTIITDSGTGCYTSNISLRNELRSTRAHNTVMVGNAEQTEWLETSLWRIRADEGMPNVLEFRSNKQGVTELFMLTAEHSSYRQRFGIVHRRSFRLSITEQHGALHVHDELIASEQVMIGVHGIVRYHLYPTVFPEQSTADCILLHAPTCTITCTANVPITLERCRISLFYGDVRETWRMCAECSVDTRALFRFSW